jgi:hypothetical protein
MVMAVNTENMVTVYNSLFEAIRSKYSEMWDNNEIDPETFAKLVGQASTQLMQLAPDIVQKQEQIDKDIEIKERTMIVQESKLEDELLTSEKQRELLKEQEKVAYTERVIKDKQAAELGLDNVLKDVHANKEDVYTPKYEEA